MRTINQDKGGFKTNGNKNGVYDSMQRSSTPDSLEKFRQKPYYMNVNHLYKKQ